MKILFVCRGNVGRSQMAEAMFRQLTGGKYLVQSAGIEAMGSEGKGLDGMLLKDRASSKHVFECLKEIRIDVSSNLIKKLTPEMIEDSDKIIVMVKPDAIPDFLKIDDRIIYWDIKDPDEQTLEFYRQTRDKVEKLVKKLIQNITEN